MSAKSLEALPLPGVAVSPARSTDARVERAVVDVVIVNHNTADDLARCIESLEGQILGGRHTITVVDTGSSDASVQQLISAAPDVGVLQLRNVGFARAANAGIAATHADVVVVANADATFTPRALAALLDALDADPELAAVGPRVVYPDGRHQDSARVMPSLAQSIGHAVLGPWLEQNPWSRAYKQTAADPGVARDAEWLSGCAFALRREALADIGGFDPRFFLFVEDVDLCDRLRGAGWRVRYEPQAVVTHVVGASTSAAPLAARRQHAKSLDLWWALRNPTARDSASVVRRPLLRVGLGAWLCSHAARLAVGHLVQTVRAAARHLVPLGGRSSERTHVVAQNSSRATIIDLRG